MRPFQTLLFVPGNRPERFEKALSSGADMVCIDLEDAVGAADKDAARGYTLDAMGDARLGLRINGMRTRQGLTDLLAVAAASTPPPFVMVPMVESAAELEIVHAILPNIPLLPLVETVKGVRAADAVATAPGVNGVMLGGADFTGQLGVALSPDALQAARGQLVMACAAANVPAIDAPHLDLDDLDALAADMRRVKAMGFSAKAIVHPKHVETVHAVMRPTVDEITEAHAAEEAYQAAGESAVRFGRKMLEAPVMARYRRILAFHAMDTVAS